MRIAYLVNQYPGVSHSFIRREILALERLGHSVDRFAARGAAAVLADPADESERTKTRYLVGGDPLALAVSLLKALVGRPAKTLAAARMAIRLSRGSPRPLVYHLVYLAQAALLATWLRESGATHLHAHFGTNSAEVALLCRLLGGPPYSFTAHGPEEFDRPRELHLAAKVAAADFVVGVSSFGRSQLQRWIPHAHWSKVEVVHCGLDSGFLQVPPTPVPATARFVCVGRLCEQKGQLLLVEALARLRPAHPSIELVLAGDGELRSEIESLIASLGISEAVRITGAVSGEQVRREMLDARALVLPSFAEGLPVVLMEALALSRPVISTYVAGIPELVIAGENGWLVPAGDVDALEHAMAECLRTEEHRLSAMGAAGRERVLERHDAVREAEKLASLMSAGPS